MSLTSSLIAFVFAAGLLTVTPGLDTVLVLRTWITEGRLAALLAALGVAAGCLVWGTAVAIGLGTALSAAPIAYDVLRWLGAAYLLYCGIRMLAAPRRDFVATIDETKTPTSVHGAFVRGLLTNILNPKVGLFYLSFLPQFVPAGIVAAPFMVGLTLIHITLGMLWFSAILSGAGLIRSIVTERADVVQWLDRLTGVVFLGFGLRLALERR